MRFTLIHTLALVGLVHGLALPADVSSALEKRWTYMTEKIDLETGDAIKDNVDTN
ncbi:hypothetical protein FKW77_010573 [Venturia effusa]|uniref:Uncharacterized protein n=1 Tax=Venturia effusa TaxID=50376 RepID=A0A517KXV4_9PEZI|nr:hypothetical protein FKW77_010573 [Venturia effusa]